MLKILMCIKVFKSYTKFALLVWVLVLAGTINPVVLTDLGAHMVLQSSWRDISGWLGSVEFMKFWIGDGRKLKKEGRVVWFCWKWKSGNKFLMASRRSTVEVKRGVWSGSELDKDMVVLWKKLQWKRDKNGLGSFMVVD